MGLRNPRAICPECGAKIHTQPRGLGHLALAGRSPGMLQTGTTCPQCGIRLSGKIGIDNRAIRAEDAGKGFMARQRAQAGSSKPRGGAISRHLEMWEAAGRPDLGERKMLDGVEVEWTATGWIPVLDESH